MASSKTLGIKVLKKILDIAGALFGSFVCFVGLVGLLEFTLPSFFIALTCGLLGIWLFPNVRGRLVSYLPPHMNTEKSRVTTGLVLLALCAIAIANNIYVSKQNILKIRERDLAEIAAAKERSEIEEKRKKNRLAEFLLKKDESISALKSLMEKKEYEKAIAMAEGYSEFKDQAVEALKDEAKKELASKLNRDKELSAKNDAGVNSLRQGYAKANSIDCSLIGKFTFNATEAYARGIPKENFVQVAWIGFAAGHPEVLENKSSANALIQIFDSVYDAGAKAGAALNLGGALKGRREPSEYVRRKIPAVAQIEMGLCVGRDKRSQETRSEYCVDTVLKNVGQGNIPFNNASKELGKCGNGD